MRDFTKIAVAFGLSALLSACAGDKGRYPSLALRPFETGALVTATAPSVTIPDYPATSPATLAALRERATVSHAAFLQREAATVRIARAGAGRSVESNARAAALVAMADLTSQRGTTSAVLAELDLLVADAAAALASDPALAAAQAEVATLVARQDAGIAQLWETMGS